MQLVLIGRENVGKSTLFNRLVGKKKALIDDLAGTTVDRQVSPAKLFDYSFFVSDTPGIVNKKSFFNVEEGDVFALVIDGRLGVTSLDIAIALDLRKSGKNLCLLVNKMEKDDLDFYDCYRLGIEPVFFISGLHGHGMDLLYYWLRQFDDQSNSNIINKRIKIAVIGRPNVGKSTFINALLGYERVYVSDSPGTTRDSIEIPFQDRFCLIDTAGIRRKTRITCELEKQMVYQSLHAVRFSDVVLLMINASEGIQKQDLKLASYVLQEGRVLLMLLNKWDLVGGESVATICNIPAFPLSALKDKNFNIIFNAINKAYDSWNKRITTRLLNIWLRDTLLENPPPRNKRKKPIKMQYITQVNTCPPTFVIFMSTSEDLPKHYIQYLIKSLRRAFAFESTSIRILFRAKKNPFFHS